MIHGIERVSKRQKRQWTAAQNVRARDEKEVLQQEVEGEGDDGEDERTAERAGGRRTDEDATSGALATLMMLSQSSEATLDDTEEMGTKSEHGRVESNIPGPPPPQPALIHKSAPMARSPALGPNTLLRAVIVGAAPPPADAGSSRSTNPAAPGSGKEPSRGGRGMGGRGGRSGGSGCSPVDNFAFSERWEPEEDHIILTMTASDAGPIHWKSVVEKLPGRTVSSARSRWLRIRKGRQVIEDGQEPQKRCHVCGKSTRGHTCEAKMMSDAALLLPPSVPPPREEAQAFTLLATRLGQETSGEEQAEPGELPPLPAPPAAAVPTNASYLRLTSIQHEYFPPLYPLALATASKASGDAGHVFLELSLRHPATPQATCAPSTAERMHACLLVQTDDAMWGSLDALAPSQLSSMWDGSSRDQLFTYLVDPQSGETTGVAGWSPYMRNTHPESLPEGATPGTWTHVEGRKIALMVSPSSITSGSYEKTYRWNTLGGRDFRIMICAEDRARYPEAICVTPAFRIMARSTLGKNAGKQVATLTLAPLPYGPMIPPQPPKRAPRVLEPKSQAAKPSEACLSEVTLV